MGEGVGRSFAALVAFGAVVQLGGTVVTALGLDTLARCELAGFATSRTGSPAVCMEPITGIGFHLFVPVAILLALFCTSIVLAALQVLGSLGAARRLEQLLGSRVRVVPAELANAAEEAGLSDIDVRDDPEPYGICLGVLHPRVVVSTGLLGALNPEELVAVVAHEERHRRRRAPLRRLVASTAVRALFYLPVLGDLSAAHVVEEEVVADAESRALVGALPLVRALAKLSSVHHPEEGTSPAFGDVLTLTYRLRTIREGQIVRPAPRRLCVALSAASLSVLTLVVLWMPLSGLH